MKNKLYNEIKNELKKRRENTKYFNREFFNKWIQAQKERKKAIQAGTDESYIKDNITLFHYFDSIYNSDLYIKNGGCYCEFLTVVSDYNEKLINL